VFGELRNLTDEDYVSVLTVKDRAATGDAILTPGESRSVYVGARLKF
jgi:iron complex outermembrane receptor protein